MILVGVVFGTLFVSHTTASSSEGGGKAESYPDISQLPPREQAVALLEVSLVTKSGSRSPTHVETKISTD